jgi:hypothetical protein
MEDLGLATATVKSIDLAAYMDQAAIDYVLAVRALRRLSHYNACCRASVAAMYRKRPSLLKKPPPDRSVAQNLSKTSPRDTQTYTKQGSQSLKRGSENDTKEFFNKLGRF